MASNFFMISSGAMDRADERMRTLLRVEGARNALMIDHGGYVFLYQGAFPFLPPQEMGAVISGAFASLNTLASMAAASDLTVKFHGSPMGCLLLAPVTKRILLAVSFAEEASAERQIRAAAKQFVEEVRPSIEAEQTMEDIDLASDLPFSSVQFIEERLNSLFDEL